MINDVMWRFCETLGEQFAIVELNPNRKESEYFNRLVADYNNYKKNATKEDVEQCEVVIERSRCKLLNECLGVGE